MQLEHPLEEEVRDAAIGLGFIVCNARDISLKKEIAVALWNVAKRSVGKTKNAALGALGFVAVQTTDLAYRKKLLDHLWSMRETNPDAIKKALGLALTYTNSADLARELINKLWQCSVGSYEICHMVHVSICREENFDAIEILVEISEMDPYDVGYIMARLAKISEPDIHKTVIKAIGRLSVEAQESCLKHIVEDHFLYDKSLSRIKVLSEFGEESPYGVVRVLAGWAVHTLNPDTRKVAMDAIQLHEETVQKAAFDYIVGLFLERLEAKTFHIDC